MGPGYFLVAHLQGGPQKSSPQMEGGLLFGGPSCICIYTAYEKATIGMVAPNAYLFHYLL